MRILRRVAATALAAALLILTALSGLLVGSAGPAVAEQPTPVVTALRRDGVFMHHRRDDDLDRDKFAAVVSDAADLGYNMAIVVPLDPLPELRSFVKRVQQLGEYDIVIGFGNEGEIEAETSDDLSNERLSALRVVRDQTSTPEETSALFLTELTTDPPDTIPSIVWTVIRWVAILVGALVVAGVAEQLWRSQSKRGRTDQPTA